MKTPIQLIQLHVLFFIYLLNSFLKILQSFLGRYCFLSLEEHVPLHQQSLGTQKYFSRKFKHESTQAKRVPGSHHPSEPPYRSLNTYTIDFYPFLPIFLHRLTTMLELLLCNWWHRNRSNFGKAENNKQKWKQYLSKIKLSCQLSQGTYLCWESESTAEWWPLKVLKVNFGKKRKKK